MKTKQTYQGLASQEVEENRKKFGENDSNSPGANIGRIRF